MDTEDAIATPDDITAALGYRRGQTIKAGPDSQLTIEKVCSITHEPYSVVVNHQGWQRWQQGALIQDALPELSNVQREFLISGKTPAEWDQIFPEGSDQ